MNTSPQRSRVFETRYVWGSNLPEAMKKAFEMAERGWTIQGNPAPMIINGHYGTGVSISRENDE
jgi:hypothetical protein